MKQHIIFPLQSHQQQPLQTAGTRTLHHLTENRLVRKWREGGSQRSRASPLTADSLQSHTAQCSLLEPETPPPLLLHSYTDPSGLTQRMLPAALSLPLAITLVRPAESTPSVRVGRNQHRKQPRRGGLVPALSELTQPSLRIGSRCSQCPPQSLLLRRCARDPRRRPCSSGLHGREQPEE